MLRLAAVLLLAGCSASLPRRLAAAEPKAEGEWSVLTPAQQFEVMREGLRGGDAETRRIAALALDPRCLTLEEIRLQMAVLAERPKEVWEMTTAPRLGWVPRRDLPVGSPDLPAIWKAALRVEHSDEIVRALSEFHRAALPSHIPELVALLPKSGDLFPILLWQLQCLASETDEHRADVARGFLIALGSPVPPNPLALVSKETFLTLAEATWLLGCFPRQQIDAADVWLAPPTLWLLRWAREVELTPADRPFLARLAAEAEQPQIRAWAVRRLARLGDDSTLARIAEGDDDVAILAAAELARRGDRERLDEIAEDMRALWYADPSRAREEWLCRFREEEKASKAAIEDGETPWTQSELFPEYPDETEAEWGSRIATEDVAWIGEQLVALGAPPELLASYYADVNPDALTAEAARRVLEGLGPPDPVVISWPVEKFLGLCEVRDRVAVVALLDRWAGTDAGRDFALPPLARLGETGRVPEMIATWDDWDSNEKWALGRVRNPRVEKFLRGKADSEEALDALSTFHGLEDPGFSWRNEFHDADWAQEPFAGARGLIVEGKPVEAVLRLAERDELKEWAAATLAGVRDPAAIAFLRRMQKEQWRGVYWVATAALATDGDPLDLAEWAEFLGEDRIWLIDWLDSWNARRWSILTAGGDAGLVRHWVSRINTNCCLKYYAYCALSELYPTIAFEHEGPGDWGQKEKTIRAWLDRHRFRRSEILRGFVPAG